MKKYLFFKFRMYEEMGGWGDFVGSFDTVEEIMMIDMGKDIKGNYGDIVDRDLEKKIYEYYAGEWHKSD